MEPILIAHLLPKLDVLLLELLKQLKPMEWEAQTLAPKWKVKDVATHLLDGNLRSLSMLRDNYFGESMEGSHSYENLVVFFNGLNSDWVKATRRLSPTVIISLLEWSGEPYCQHLQSLDPFGKAVFSVDWAGEIASKNWFHIAREYTEKWHHQQQIRIATGHHPEMLLMDDYFLPYLKTSIRGLPHRYRKVQGEEGDTIEFSFVGEKTRKWHLTKREGRWELMECNANNRITSKVIVENDVAWRIFTKGIPKEKAIEKSQIEGEMGLAEPFFDLVAIVG